MLAPQLKQLHRVDGEALLARAIHKTKRQIKVLAAGLAPKPDVPPSIRKVPEKRKQTEQEAPRTDASDAASENHPSSEAATTNVRNNLDLPAIENGSTFVTVTASSFACRRVLGYTVQ